MTNLSIFVSGNGTNMENLIRQIQAGKVTGANVALVVCDNPDAKAMEKAKKRGVEVALFERKNFASKHDFEMAMVHKLREKKIDWIALAGYMKILSPDFVKEFHGRIINIHPSLLPAFPGGHSIKDAFDAKVKETGVTVHFVDEGVDTGPVILQRKVPVAPNDTLDSLESKVHAVEYEIYPEALALVVAGKVRYPKHGAEDWVKD